MEQVTDLGQVKEQKDFLRYSRDVVHSYSKAAGRLIDLAIDHFELAFAEGRKGKKVIWNNSFCTPIIYACGGIPLGLPDLGRYGLASSVAEAENYFQIPAETCAMIKSILGGLYQYRKEPCGWIISNGTRCEPELTAMSTVGSFGYKILVIDIYKKPDISNAKRMDMFENSYKKAIDEVVAFVTDGGTLDKEKLHEELARANRVRGKVSYLRELQSKHATYYKTLPTFLAISGAANYFGQPELFEEIIDEMIEEISNLLENSYNDDLVKLVWSGLRGVDFSVYNAVDIAGATIVDWNLPGSIKERYDLEIDPVEAVLKRATSGRYTRSMLETCMRDEQMINQSGAKGAILYSTLGCTQHTIDTETKRIYLSKQGIPNLVLAGTAQIGEVTGQVMTRMRAFTEMLS